MTKEETIKNLLEKGYTPREAEEKWQQAVAMINPEMISYYKNLKPKVLEFTKENKDEGNFYQDIDPENGGW